MALDLDGTLLQEDKTVAVRDAQAVRRAVSLGVRVVIASARPPRGTRAIMEGLGLRGPQVNYNGALVCDVNGNAARFETLRHRPMAFEWVKRVVLEARLREPTVRADLEVMDRWVTDRGDEQGMTATAKLCPPDVVAAIDAWEPTPVTKLMLSGEAGAVASLRRWLDAEHGPMVSMVQTEPWLLQVVAAGVDKGEALAWLCGRLGVDCATVLAVGDNENDEPMLRWAGTGVAMGHAPDAVKASADAVVATNVDNGVAEAIERWVLSRF